MMRGLRPSFIGGLVFGFLVPSAVPAQPFIERFSDPAVTYGALAQSMEGYFTGRFSGRASGFKQFQRTLRFHVDRTKADGTVVNGAAHVWDAVRALATLPQVGGSWTFVAPEETEPAQVAPANALSLTPGMGRLNVADFDPNDDRIIYVGSASGGLWRSNDGGSSWHPLTDQAGLMAISDIAIDRRDGRNIYLLTGDGEGFTLPSAGVVVSKDAGQTWTSTGLTFPPQELVWGHRLLINPVTSSTLLAATSQHIYHSTDAGTTWSPVADGNFRDLEFHPANPAIVYASTSTQILRSTDGGGSWQGVAGLPNSDPVPTSRIALGISRARPDAVYAVAGNENGFAGLYRSDDAGQTFVLRSLSPNILGASPQGTDNLSHAWYDLSLAIDPVDADIVYVGGINIWSSTDGGSTWALSGYWQEAAKELYSYVHPDIHQLVIRNGQIYAATDGGLWTKGPGFPRWTPLYKGLAITEIFSVCAGPGADGSIMYGAQDNGTNIVIGNKAVQVWGGDGTICQIDPTQNYLFMASQFGNIYVSANGGELFTPAWPNAPATPPSGNYVTPYQLHPQLPQYIYACYQDVYLGLRGTTFGATSVKWQQLTAGALSTELCSAMRVAPSDASVVYVAKPTALFRGNGLVWQQVTGAWSSTVSTITEVAVASSNPHRVAITLGGYAPGEKIFYSSTGGDTWSNISGNLPNVPASVVLFEDGPRNGIYVGTDVGVFYRNDDLDGWALMGDNLPRVAVRSLVVQPGTNRLIAGTFGRGVFKVRLINPPVGAAMVE